jgi:hypothetical protein
VIDVWIVEPRSVKEASTAPVMPSVAFGTSVLIVVNWSVMFPVASVTVVVTAPRSSVTVVVTLPKASVVTVPAEVASSPSVLNAAPASVTSLMTPLIGPASA